MLVNVGMTVLLEDTILGSGSVSWADGLWFGYGSAKERQRVADEAPVPLPYILKKISNRLF